MPTSVPIDGMRIFKYGTGDSPPIGSIYLGTIVNERITSRDDDKRYVWHYFLVKE
jgi:hypothetical protein